MANEGLEVPEASRARSQETDGLTPPSQFEKKLDDIGHIYTSTTQTLRAKLTVEALNT